MEKIFVGDAQSPSVLQSLPVADVLDLLSGLATIDPRLVRLTVEGTSFRARCLVPGWTDISVLGPTENDALWSLELALSSFLTRPFTQESSQ